MIDRFEIDGGTQLNGNITCAGAKNAALPIMAASLLTEGTTELVGVPDLQDTRTMAMVLRVIGADVHLKGGVMTLDCGKCNFWEALYELVRKMRAAFYVLGPLIARFGRARVSLPGGCNLGPRPVDLHLKGLQHLGCSVEIDRGYVVWYAARPRGAARALDSPRIGASVD